MIEQTSLIRSSDWKSMIVLDACRYDYFKKSIDIDGDLIRADSVSIGTRKWYERNWKGEHDIVLISASPVPKRQNFQSNFSECYEIWSEENWLNIRAGLDRASIVKEKKIVHLLPPHLPYIGPKGKKFMREIGVPIKGSRDIYTKVQSYGREKGWERPRECYRESIEVALDSIKDYLDDLEDVVITSDHGELLGELNKYDHSYKDNHMKLREVPWFVVEQ